MSHSIPSLAGMSVLVLEKTKPAFTTLCFRLEPYRIKCISEIKVVSVVSVKVIDKNERVYFIYIILCRGRNIN